MAETREQMLERARILYLTESDPGGLNFLLKNKMGLSGGAIVALKTRWETEGGYKKRLAGAGYGRGAEVAPPPRKPGIFSRIFGRKDDISSKEAEKIAGELYALKMKSMAKNTPKALPPPVDAKQLFFEGKRAEAGKIMMQRGMSGKQIEDSFSAWSKEGRAGNSIIYPSSGKALPQGVQGSDEVESLIENLRLGNITGDFARHGIAELVRDKYISAEEGNAALTKVSGISDTGGNVIVPRHLPSEGKFRKYVSSGFQSTKQGGLRPTMQQIRAPLYGRVQDRGDINRMKGMDPNLRSAINEARLKLQKEAAKVGPKYKEIITDTEKELEGKKRRLEKVDEDINKIVEKFKEIKAKSKSPSADSSSNASQGREGGI